MISGGDMAMVSPVWRTMTPRSKHLRNTSKARAPGLPGARLELDGADQP
jgi:hypothetical protein